MLPADDNITVAPTPQKTKVPVHPRTRSKIQIKPEPNDFASAQLENWTPPVPPTTEPKALQSLKAEWKRHLNDQPMYDGYDSRKELVIIDLHDFQIYRSPELGHEGRRYELTSLHHLERPRAKKLCFDGFLCLSNIRYYVCSVPIADSSIEGYGDHEDPQVVSYVQSELARKDGYQFDIWYRLNKPTPNYQRFYDPFLWVAQLGKHVLDYMDEAPARSVRLDSFRQEFHGWLTRRFAQNNDFQRWHSQFRRQVDFRNGVNAYIEYICLQAANLPNPNQLLGHPLWGECMARGSTIIKQQELVIKNTIATPDVYKLFKNMYFGNCLLKQRPENLVELEQARRKRRLGFPDVHTVSTTHRVCHPYGTSPVRVGDVVALDPDAKDRTLWRSSDLEWLAYVQAIEALENGTQRLSVLWLYRPRETNISKAKYLFDNELFFSDNCNCTERKLLSTDVKGRYDIAWSPSTINKNGRFFIRQTYITQESAFVTFTKEHNTCVCRKKKTSPVDSYRPGDTAYLRTSNKELIDPVLIININRATGFVTVRKLLRLGRDCSDLAIKAHRSNVAPNELVLSDEYEDVSAVRIQQRCFVKFVSKLRMLKDNVPFPYNQNGAGHLWFLSMGLLISNNNRHLMFLRALPSIFHEGPDIALDQKLKGVSIFSGGGSLDRGLEEGGAVEFHTAVDISPEACHTQLANAKDPVNIRIYCGSVDDYINAALAGSKSQLIARIGDVDFIAAGSPCPGFSALQQKIFSENSLRNASHISTFCSFVDLYRPQYAILENVVNIAYKCKDLGDDQNVLSQVVASLVSMGYQVEQCIMDAWSYGSAQHRSRVFLCIAAPGLDPIIPPRHTHTLTDNETRGQSLGELPNGQRFGQREYYPTSFHYTSAGDVTSDLPNIGNGIMQTCIPYPNHRLLSVPNRNDRALLECIPKSPAGCGYKTAYKRDLIPPLLQKDKKKDGKAFTRIKKAGLFSTITTAISLQDSRNGSTLHWDEHRSITIEEARRAQGYREHECIIGSLAEQYKIVGNGVDRRVSFPIGLGLRQAVLNNSHFTADGTTKTAMEVIEIQSDTEDYDYNDKSGIEPVQTQNNKRNADDDDSDTSVQLLEPPSKRMRTSTSDKVRYTRHSGLPVQFVPKSWNRRPEDKRQCGSS